MQHHHPEDAFGVLNSPFGAGLRATLASDENVRAALSVDLDADLHFGAGWLVVTQRRLLACDPGVGTWREWALAPGQSLRLFDHGGVGTVELHDAHQRLAFWRFTLGAQAQALQLVQRFEQLTARWTDPQGCLAEDAEEARCAVCQEVLPPDSEECPACARAQAPQPSTWVLLRLWRFARPYRKQLAAGFGLTLASTAATLVPPYLTIPLMDDILIPVPERTEDRSGPGAVVSGGLACLGAAGLGPGLGAHLHPGAGVRAHRRGPAHHDLRAFAAPLARLLRWKTHRRPDGTDRLGDRPHQCLSCRCMPSISSPTC
jgi:ATP-binding cassette subfamily B protein